MTDSDIINALECCAKFAQCTGCGYYKERDRCCVDAVMEDAVAMLKRQQAEIERLKEENAKLDAEVDKQYEQARADILGNMADGGTSCHWCIAEHKKNAVKNFAAKLKAKAYKAENEWSHGEHPMVVELDDIDDVLEEMEERNE